MQQFFRFFRVLSAVTLLCCTALPAWANLDVRSAILMDMKSGKVLYAQGADTRIPPASLTKIMTMSVTMDQIKAGKVKLKDKVKISKLASLQGGSRMHIRAGEHVTLDKLLMGVAVSSGNDASMAVAEHVAGSQQAFVRMMNAKAKQLGLKNTVFVNPHGLPAKGQVTSARDMLIISSDYLKNYPNAMRYHRMKTLLHRGTTTYNKNPLLKDCPGADGLKTGWIRASGYNLISTVKRGDTRLVGVVLGSENPRVRAREMRALVEAGFTALQGKSTKNVNSILAERTIPKPTQVASSTKAKPAANKAGKGKGKGKASKVTNKPKAKAPKATQVASTTKAKPTASKEDKANVSQTPKKMDTPQPAASTKSTQATNRTKQKKAPGGSNAS